VLTLRRVLRVRLSAVQPARTSVATLVCAALLLACATPATPNRRARVVIIGGESLSEPLAKDLRLRRIDASVVPYRPNVDAAYLATLGPPTVVVIQIEGMRGISVPITDNRMIDIPDLIHVNVRTTSGGTLADVQWEHRVPMDVHTEQDVKAYLAVVAREAVDKVLAANRWTFK